MTIENLCIYVNWPREFHNDHGYTAGNMVDKHGYSQGMSEYFPPGIFRSGNRLQREDYCTAQFLLYNVNNEYKKIENKLYIMRNEN